MVKLDISDNKIMKNKYSNILFLVIFMYGLFFSVFRINDSDEGYILTASMRILHGELPYKDFFLHTPPVSYYAMAALFRIFGQQLIVARVATVVIGLLISILLYLISLKIMTRKAALISPLIFMFWGTAHASYPSFAWFGLLFALISLYLFILSLEREHFWYIFGAGFFIGMSFLSKQNIGTCTLIVFILFLLVDRLLSAYFGIKKASNIALIKNLILLISSFVIPVIITVYLFYLKGALPDFIKYVFWVAAKSGISRRLILPFHSIRLPQLIIFTIYMLIFYVAVKNRNRAKIANLSMFLGAIFIFLIIFAVIWERRLMYFNYSLDHIKAGAVFGFFNLLVLVCDVTIVLFFIKIKDISATIYIRRKKVLLLAIFALLYAWAGLFISRDLLHHIFSFPPTFIVIAYVFYQAKLYIWKKARHFYKDREKSEVFARFPLNCVVIFPIIYFLLLGFATNINNEVFRDSEPPLYKMSVPVRLERSKYILADPESARDITGLVNFLSNAATQNEKIFYTYSQDGEIYFLANRVPASFFHFIHGDTVKPSDQGRIIDDIIKNKTRFIFMTTERFNNSAKLCDPKYNSNTYNIEKYIHDNYKLQKEFGKFVVLKRGWDRP